MDLKSYVREHRRLVQVLKKPTQVKLHKEAILQEEDLKEATKKGNALKKALKRI